MDISDWRKKIDELDEQIVQLISKRAEAAKAIGELKRETQLPVYEPGREQAVFNHVRAVNPGARFTETPMKIWRTPPRLGEHTEEILLELGYSWEEIGALREAEAV